MDEQPQEEGFSGCFWLMLLLGIVGVIGFFTTAGVALTGG